MKQPRQQNPRKQPHNGNGNGNGHALAAVADRQLPLEVSNENPLLRLLKPLASLKFTVILLALSMVLIFAGTTIQTEKGIWDVQRLYFHCWITFIEWRLFFPLWDWGRTSIPGAIPFPGGFALITLLLLNLLAAHTLRFKLSWKRSGIFLIHAGLILLLVGEVVTAERAVESQMTIDVGSSANFASDTRHVELAVTDPSPADHDDEIIVPAAKLVRGAIVQSPKLPFAIHIDDYHDNSDIFGPVQVAQMGLKEDSRATAGAGMKLTVAGRPKVSGTDNQIDLASSYVTLIAGGHSLGTYLVSLFFSQPQTVNVDGKPYWIQLRWKRYYKPYTVELLKFTHDRYQGTDTPKNFASLIRLTDPSQNVDRQVNIWMNHPLRYAGETFYQASFKPGDQTTILQVVHNPGWLIPYISCSMIGLGLLVHFGLHLLKFLKNRNTRNVRGGAVELQVARGSWIPAVAITGICALYLVGLAFPTQSASSFDVATFATLPISYEGRTMPLDSLARNSLRIISGYDEVRLPDDKRLPAIDWLLDVFSQSDKVLDYKIFNIDNPEVLSLLGLKQSWRRTSTLSSLIGMDERERFTPAEVLSSENIQKLTAQYNLIKDVDEKKLDLYQRKILDLMRQGMLLKTLSDMKSLYLSPPLVNPQWRPLDEVSKEMAAKNTRDPGAEAIAGMVEAYGDSKSADFNSLATEYHKLIQQKMPDTARKLDLEVMFNRTDPFIQCMVLYVMVFILAIGSWLKWHQPLARAALWLLVLTLAFHTFGLIARVYIQGRPPVTNLYSSAIFIAWGAVMFCVALELIYRNAIATAAAAAIAFPSLLIAHYLAASGDTMQMLQAVLDTNIWLATHVVVVTLGYTATFLAGFLAIAYIMGGVLFPSFNADARKTLYRMIYGVVCFAMLFSFVGTILGGIWADQSWGRFWGWDPKENGAVLIVLWNAIILHARWGGLVRERGFANLAVAGNIVTSWSWFGTNMLGVGLHSYGFMDSAAFWLLSFVAIQIGIIAVGSLPLSMWRSFASASGFSARPI